MRPFSTENRAHWRDRTGVHLSHAEAIDPSRRDFLYLGTAALGVVGVGAVVWPLVDQMNPDASTLAMASIEVDLAPIAGRSDPGGEMARRPGVHPPPHGQGDQGG